LQAYLRRRLIAVKRERAKLRHHSHPVQVRAKVCCRKTRSSDQSFRGQGYRLPDNNETEN
jgi:hypothetical protein